MSALIIDYNNKDELEELSFLFKNGTGWNVHFAEETSEPYKNLDQKISQHEIDFLLCTRQFTPTLSTELNGLKKRYPLLTIIYYNAILKENDFAELYRAGIKFCFIGSSRKNHLKEMLSRLQKEHWRRIPENIYDVPYSNLPARAKRMLQFIEKHPTHSCTVKCLAEHLHISPSHLRKEFKRHFGINFREFKNRLFKYYEDTLLFEKALKPGDIYKILNYKNLSAFSRSFRLRHGNSWQAIVRQKNLN